MKITNKFGGGGSKKVTISEVINPTDEEFFKKNY